MMPLSRSFSCHFHAEASVSSMPLSSRPAQHLVGLGGVGPHLLDVAFAAAYDLVGNLSHPWPFRRQSISSSTDTPRPVPRLKISIASGDFFSSMRFMAIT